MAAGGLIGALRVTLGLDSAAFEQGMGKAERTSRAQAKQIADNMGVMAKASTAALSGMKLAFAGFGAGVVVSGLKAAVNDGLEYASSLGEVAQQLGVSTKALQEYRFIATQVGISQDQIDAGLGRLTKALGQAAEGNKPLQAAFAQLGVTARDADSAMPQLVAGLSAIPDPAKRAALEVAIFGKAGQALDTMLAGGVGQIDELKNAAQRLGIVLSDKQIQQADDTADKLSMVSTVLKARIAGEVADNAKAIYGFADALAYAAGQAIETSSRISKFMALAGQLQARGLTGPSAFIASRMAMYADDKAEKETAARQDKMSAGTASWLAKITGDARDRVSRTTAVGGGTGGSTRRTRTGGSRPRAFSGPSLADQQRQIFDSLFPNEAQTRELQERMATLGKALAAKLVSPADYDRANVALQAQLKRIGDTGLELIDRYMPDEARRRELEADIAELDRRIAKNIGDPANWTAAKVRAQAQLAEVVDGIRQKAQEASNELLGIGTIMDSWAGAFGHAVQEIDAHTDQATGKLSDWRKDATDAADGVGTSFANAAQSVAGSLDAMARSFSSGGLLGKLQGILGLATSLGSVGAFGKGFQAMLALPLSGARAGGGPVMGGGAYLVGERGPEILQLPPRTNGTVIPNHAIAGAMRAPQQQAVAVHVTPSPLFNITVTQLATTQAASVVGATAKRQAQRAGRRLA